MHCEYRRLSSRLRWGNWGCAGSRVAQMLHSLISCLSDICWRRHCYVGFVIQLAQMTRDLAEGIHWIIWPNTSSLKCKGAPKGIIKQGSVCLII